MPTTQAIFQIVTPAAPRQQLDHPTSNCDQQIQTIVTTSTTFATTTTKKRVNFCSSCVEPAVIRRDFAFSPDDPRYWLLAIASDDDEQQSTTVQTARQKPQRKHSTTIKKPSYRKTEISPGKGGTSHKGSASKRNGMVATSMGIERPPTPFPTLERQISSHMLLQKSITLFKHAASRVANYRPSSALWF
ncbi:hypothetical protein CKM354_000286200 [Cercospora kikuchii]|uniref:Uncharacterized protein n=1 Tax=Cercospora kikuchii TaxID=84275 RepID=A0A9P3FEF7_9PEZI|nr:uncharacterized protein CKM354_000286200 [Cercospora kikuchii]GIZ39480.1 hypothetical protein CKM354_000286200 [Cercospora kikuchii]